MAQHDDESGKPKPLFVPPAPGTKPSTGSSSLFAPPTFPKPAAKVGPVAPTIVPAKAPPSASSSSSSLAKPSFGEWPTELEAATPSAPAKVEVAKVEPEVAKTEAAKVEPEVAKTEPAKTEPEPAKVEASDADRPSEPLPDEPTAPIEVAAPRPSASASNPRAPLHARKTSTQAHSIVGEFGVPEPPSGSRPSTPIVEGRVKGQRDDDEESTESRDDLVPSRPEPVYDDTEETDEEPKPLPIEAFASTRASEPAPKRNAAVPLMIGVGLAAVLAIAWVFGSKDRNAQVAESEPKPNAKQPAEIANAPKPAQPQPQPVEPSEPAEPSEPEPLHGSATAALDTETDTDEGGSDEAPEPRPSNVDPRDRSVIPAGTSEEAIKAFTKLPVSIHDGPPLGGIGRTGIHIDDIATGAEVRNGNCLDEAKRFSIASTKEVSVCFRVVHDREEESVRVLWDKDGTTVRRGNVRIRDLHAYKTRAYLELRAEYEGKWRVRIVSEDDVELATHEFELVP